MQSIKTLVAIFLLALTGLAKGAVDNQLIELLAPLVNGSGHFEQITYDHSGQAVQRSNGQFAVMKPGKFYWQTLEPYEQLLVSNAQTIWLYDPDLEQVTVKSFSSEANQLPIRILSGEFELLDKEFSLTREQAESKTIFHLTPLQAQSNIQVIDLTFIEQDLTSMKVTDTTHTATEFYFRQRQPLTPADKRKFDFNIPEGADVFHDGPS